MENLTNHELRIIIASLIFNCQMSQKVGKLNYVDDASLLISKLIDQLPIDDQAEWVEQAEQNGINLHEAA